MDERRPVDGKRRRGLAASGIIGALRLYQLTLSSVMGRRCRYLPTCSEYAMEAVDRHGPWRGLRLGVSRVLRCHPWGGDGFDPVPPREP